MTTSKSEANTSLPPPIDWAAKPKPSPVATNLQVIDHSASREHVEDSRTPARRLVPVFISPDHIADLREALRCFSALGSPHRQPKLELQVDTIVDAAGNDHNDQKIFCIRQANSQQSQQEDAHVDMSMSSEDQDLASTLSRLSMSTLSPSCQHVTRNNPVTPSSMNSASSPRDTTAPVPVSGMPPQTSDSLRRMRYYVVLIGKRAGIYYDEWENVKPLIDRVSNARFRGFSTQKEAEQFYLDAKRMNKIRIVRNPGDDKKYGPIEEAIQ